MATSAEDSDSDIWLEEGNGKHFNQRRRPVGSENEVERLVRSISSDDQWIDDNTDDENSNDLKSWRKTSGKTYHDPTVDTIPETENLKWNVFDGGSSENEEVTTSGKYSLTPISESNSPLVSNKASSETLEKEATSMPVLILRYFRKLKKEKNIEQNLTKEDNREVSTPYTPSPNESDGRSVGQKEPEKIVQINHSTNEDTISHIKKTQSFFVRLADKMLHRHSQKKDIKAVDAATDEPKFCPLCGHALEKVGLSRAFANLDKHSFEKTRAFEARLTSEKMWKTVWVSMEGTTEGKRGSKVFRTELRVDIKGNKTSEGVCMGDKIELAKFISS